jgi:hypothetical protein
MNRLLVGMRLKVAGLLIAFTLSLSALYASVPVQVWISADDRLDLYVGDASGSTLSYIGSTTLGWTEILNTSFLPIPRTTCMWSHATLSRGHGALEDMCK